MSAESPSKHFSRTFSACDRIRTSRWALLTGQVLIPLC